MSVPSRVDAAALLLSLSPPPWHLRHSRAVAEIAGWLAARIAARTADPSAIDRPLVEAAALLHDVDKLLPDDSPARALGHGAGSAAWLAGRGRPELGLAVAAHPVTRLLDAGAAERWLASAPLEERVLAYADKRAGQRLEPMAARFASWQRRYPGGPGSPGEGGWEDTVATAVRERADRLEADVCAAAGVMPREVRRLRWTGRALRVALARPDTGAPAREGVVAATGARAAVREGRP